MLGCGFKCISLHTEAALFKVEYAGGSQASQDPQRPENSSIWSLDKTRKEFLLWRSGNKFD